MVELSVITINYNSVNHTLEMLASLKRSFEGCSYECIVLDNGSAVDESVIIRSNYPEYEIIRSDKNLGFAAGNNLCLERATGSYLFFVNNDTLLLDSSVKDIISHMQREKKIGAVSPKILFYKPENTLQFAGFTPLSRITLRNRAIGFLEIDRDQYRDPQPTHFLHGAAMIVRRDVITAVGGMPEDYFLYYEEMDWSESIKRAGYELWYLPFMKIIHKESSTVGAGSPLKKYYITRNRLLFAKRNRSKAEFLLFVLYFTLFSVTKDITLELLKGRIGNSASIVEGCIDFFKQKFGEKD